MHASILLIAAAVSSVIAQAPTGAPSACVTTCNAVYSACRTAPGANQATCASQYAACVGYVPFVNGTLVAPTACSAGATGTITATAAPTADACVAKCNAAANACRTAPGANQSFCSAQYAQCLGYNPYGVGATASFVSPTACSPGATGSATAVVTSTKGSNNGTNPTAKPTFVPANDASVVSGGVVGVAGLIAAFFL